MADVSKRVPHLEHYGTKDEFKFVALQAVPEILIRVSNEQTKAAFRECLHSRASRQNFNRFMNSPRAPAKRVAVNPNVEATNLSFDLNNVSLHDDSILD
jgi:hypothetical protein